MRDSYGSRGGGGGGGNGPVAKIYIGNLSSRVSEREIYDTFGKYGSIRKVELKNHYGFVVCIISDEEFHESILLFFFFIERELELNLLYVSQRYIFRFDTTTTTTIGISIIW